MLRVTLEQWRMFRAVVEFGGFNQAAQHIHKSQSSIHSAVSKIEESLGVKLFLIEGRKTLLTEAGELMLRRAHFLLEEAAKIEVVGQTLAQGVESKLRIAVDEIFPDHLLYQVLEKTSAQFPMLQIELVESILTGATELLEKAEVDIAISSIKIADGFHEALCHIEFVAVAHPDHPLHHQTRQLTLEDLKSHRQIVVRDSAVNANKNEGWLIADQRWTVSHMRTSINMIAQGLGYAWLPISSIQQLLNTGDLKPLPLVHYDKRYAQLHLIFKDGDSLGPAARTFLGELRMQCMSLPSLNDEQH